MPPVKEAKDAPEASAEAPNEELLEGFTDGLAWMRVKYRDVEYKIVELAVGDYDEITKKATRKERVTDPETGAESEVELLDQQLQSRMMLKQCIVEPEKIDVTKLGTRLTVHLNRIVNRLHYGEELDQLRPVKKGDDDEGKSGNV